MLFREQPVRASQNIGHLLASGLIWRCQTRREANRQTLAMEEEVQHLNGSRVEALWAQLDPQGEGSIDFEGLRDGLKKINHRE